METPHGLAGSTGNVKVVRYKNGPTRHVTAAEFNQMLERVEDLGQPQKTYEFIVDIEEVQLVPFDPDTLTFMAATPELRARYAIKRDFAMIGVQDTTMVLPMVNGKPPVITREVLEEIKAAYQKVIFMRYRIADTKTDHLQVIATRWQKLAADNSEFQRPYAEVNKKLVDKHVSATAYEDLKEFNRSVLSIDHKLDTILNTLGENLKRLNTLISRLPDELLIMDVHLIVEYELCALRLRAYNSLIAEYRKFFKRNVLPGVPALTLTHPDTQQGIMDKLTETTHWLGENQSAVTKCERSANRINRAVTAAAAAAASIVKPDEQANGNSSKSTRVKMADTPKARAFQFIEREVATMGIKFGLMVPMSQVNGEIHPAIDSLRIQLAFEEYMKRFSLSLPLIDIDADLAARVVNKWINQQTQIHPDFTIEGYGTSDLSSAERAADHLRRIGPEFHTLMSKFNASWLARMDRLEELVSMHVSIGEEFAALTEEVASLAQQHVDVRMAFPLDLSVRFDLRHMQMMLCNAAFDRYLYFMDSSIVPGVQVSDLLNSGQLDRANELLEKTNVHIADNAEKFRVCVAIFKPGHPQGGAPEIKQSSTVGSSSSSAQSTASSVMSAKEKYLTEQLERLRQKLPDTADARAYKAAFTVLASVDLSIDTWVQLQTDTESGGYDVTFPSDVIPDICGAYATKLVATFPPVGTDLKEAKRLASSWAAAMRALATGRTATAETLEIVEFQSRISDWGRATANRLKPVVQTLETLVPRMEKIKRALNKKKTEWPVDLDTDYNLCMTWQDTICVPLSKHVLYLLTPLHGDIAFIHLMDKDAQKACMSFVQTFKAGQDKLAIISANVRQLVERTLDNIERLKQKQEQAARSNSGDDKLRIQPVQYQATSSSSSSSSTAVPNSQKRKEKIKTRAGHMAAVDEDDSAPVIDNLYISDVDEDRPQGAGLTPFELRKKKIADQNKGWDKDRIRAAAHREILAEEKSRQMQRDQIEALRKRVENASSQDDLPAVAAVPPGGHSKFAAASSSTDTGEDTMTYLPGGHTGHLTEKQAKKLAKKQAKATSLDEFHAQMEAEKKRQAAEDEMRQKEKQKEKQKKKKKK
jgi:hypothetical protein